MVKVSKVEKDIEREEGFKVIFRHSDGSDVSGTKAVKSYKKPKKMAKNSYSVSEWIEKRFKKQYPQFNVDVLNADKKKAGGNTKLAKVRDTYLPDE